jgi:hypothetical protein
MELLLLFLLGGLVLAVVVTRSSRRTVSQARLQPGVTGWKVVAPAGPPVVEADVVSMLSRLGRDVRELDPGPDPVARQALADASERWTTSRDVLERADSQELLRTAWVAAVEGLEAAAVVRRRLGLDPGPPVPALPGSGPALTAATDVVVDGQVRHGSPAYEPGRSHWFPGGEKDGSYVPRGWYDDDPWPDGFRGGDLWR